MSEVESKQLFDIIFMVIMSIVLVFSLFYGIYKGFHMSYMAYKKRRVLKKIQQLVSENKFLRVITHDKNGIPILVQVKNKNNTEKIMVL